MDAVAIMYAINDATMVIAVAFAVIGFIVVWQWDRVHKFIDAHNAKRKNKRRKHK